VLVISHRFSNVRGADRIYVLEEGRVIEQGGHGALMSAGGTYARLFRLRATAYQGTASGERLWGTPPAGRGGRLPAPRRPFRRRWWTRPFRLGRR
jgi:hypothetical protein